MQSFAAHPDDPLVHLRLLQRYMSAGIMLLAISRGGFIVSILLLLAGGVFIVVGRFFFWERYYLYGCQPDYTTSITCRLCPVEWQHEASSYADTSTVACLTSGAATLLMALLYPYALLAIKGDREEGEEIRSVIHLEYESASNVQGLSLLDCERIVLRVIGLAHSYRSWNYFHHRTLEKHLKRRRRLRRFAACLWSEIFVRVTLREYTFPVIISLFALSSTVITPSLMTESSILLRVSSVFASLLAYVTILNISLAAFFVILIIDPTAWMGCLAFWGVYLCIHLGAFAIHNWTSRVSEVLHRHKFHKKVPLSVLRAVFNQAF